MLSRIPRTHISIAGHRHGAFYVTGWSGFWLAVALTLSLAAVRGLSVLLQAGIAAAAAAVYFSIVALVRHRTGRETLVYYHHILVFLAVAAGVAALAGQPVLAYLDITACGLALFTAAARVGCLMVGCCHGRPARDGIAYGPEHQRHGVPAYLVGQHLIPVQAMEAAGCAVLTVITTVAVLTDAPQGTAFALFIAGYALLRFGLEWLRGDLARRYLHGLSEAQLISLALAVAVGVGGATGVLPWGAWAVVPALILLVATLATIAGQAPGRRELLAPVHVMEVAHRLGRLELSRPDRVFTAVSSRGLKVSLGETDEHVHYTLSTTAPLSEDGGQQLARLVLWLCRDEAEPELSYGRAGTVHVVTPRTTGTSARRDANARSPV
jgi:prolipoprotein diacylglyceryl transferase